MTDETEYDMTADDLARVIVGKRVVEVDEAKSILTLDDGTTLEFEDVADCCAWFSADLKAGHLTDNAVTALEVVENENDDSDVPEDYSIHILAADTRIADLTITGDPTSGYYCHSITLRVKGGPQ